VLWTQSQPGWRETNVDEYLKAAAGPAPWYWRTFPTDFGDGYAYRWALPNGTWVPLLQRGPGWLPILGVHRYWVIAGNPGYIAFWSRLVRPRNGFALPNDYQLDVQVFELASLPAAPHLFERNMVAAQPGARASIVADAHPCVRVTIPDRLDSGEYEGARVPQLASLREVFLIAGGPRHDLKDETAPMYSIYIWCPGTGRVQALHQKWFAEATFDPGYEWITRVARNPNTGRLVGDGIRISPFELDHTGTQLSRHS